MGGLKLIVQADRSSLRKVLRRIPGKPFTWVYVGQDIAKYNQVRQTFEDTGTQQEITHRFHQAAEDLRQPYLKYLYDLVRQYDTLRSWITSLSYRSGYVSKTFHRACNLKIALDLLRDWPDPEPLVVAVADVSVLRAMERNLKGTLGEPCVVLGSHHPLPLQSARDTFRMLVHRLFFVIRETRQLLQSRWLIRHPFIPSEPTTLILTPVHSGNLDRGGDFHKTSFGDLAHQLTQRGRPVALAPIVLREASYKNAVTQTSKSPFPLMVPHRYLRFKDIINSALSSLVKPPTPSQLPIFSGMDVATIVEEDLRADWVSNQAADSLRMAAVVRRWAKTGASINRMIYRYENQPWERALCWEAKRALPNTALVGYQHARAPRLLLSYYLAPGEADDAPLPHRVVTNGKYTARLLSQDGYDPSRIRVGGALQVPDFIKQGQSEQVQTSNKPVGTNGSAQVLVASSFGLEEAVELVDLSARLFSATDGVRVVIKCHPTTTIKKIQGLLSTPLPEHVQVSERPIADLMLESSVLVYTGSSVCIQALAQGLPVVHLRPRFDLDMDPLESYPELRLEATGLEEFQAKVRWILDHRAEYVAQHRERWQEVTQEMYGPVTEDSYLAFVE